jgi:hypothetical protein
VSLGENIHKLYNSTSGIVKVFSVENKKVRIIISVNIGCITAIDSEHTNSKRLS